MNSNPFKVLVIGAGAGGLCLAQGLKRDGIDAQVFEQDLEGCRIEPRMHRLQNKVVAILRPQQLRYPSAASAFARTMPDDVLEV